MSKIEVLTDIAKPLWKAFADPDTGEEVVRVESALDKALDNMPDQPMTPDQMGKALRKRGVQEVELEQSGVNGYLRGESFNSKPEGERVTPADIKKGLEGRQDGYYVNTIKGTPVDTGAFSEAQFTDRWSKAIDDVAAIPSTTGSTRADVVHYYGDNFDKNKLDELYADMEQELKLAEQKGNRDDILAIENVIDDLDKMVIDYESIKTQQKARQFDWDELQNRYGIVDENLEMNYQNVDALLKDIQQEKIYPDSIDISPTEDMAKDADLLSKMLAEMTMTRPELERKWARVVDTYGLHSNNIDDIPAFKEQAVADLADAEPGTDPQLVDFYEDMKELENDYLRTTNNMVEMPEKAYFDFTLPGTDRLSYEVRLYNNSRVKSKTPDGDRHSHWPGDESKEYVAHTRVDSPEPGVRRIQEVQSDLQNYLSENKQTQIKRWRDAGEIEKLSLNNVMNDSYDPDSVAIQVRTKLQAKAGQYLKDKGFISGDLVPEETHGAWRQDVVRELFKNRMDNESLEELVATANDVFRLPSLSETLVQKHFPELSGSEHRELTRFLRNLNDEFWANAESELSTAKRVFKEEEAPLRATEETRRTRVLGDAADSVMSADQREARDNIRNSVASFIKNHETLGKGIKEAALDGSRSPHTLANAVRDIEMTNEGMDVALVNKLNYALDDIVDNTPGMTVKEREAMEMALYNYEPEAIKALKESGSTLYPAYAKAAKVMNYARQEYEAAKVLMTPLRQPPSNSEFALDVPWAKQILQEEFVEAIARGQKEVWLTVSPQGVKNLARGKGPHTQYQEGGRINKTFRSLAKRFNADIRVEDGYVKAILKTGGVAGGAAALSIPAYADTNNNAIVDKINAAREAGASEDDINTMLSDRPDLLAMAHAGPDTVAGNIPYGQEFDTTNKQAPIIVPAYTDTNNNDFYTAALREGHSREEIEAYIRKKPMPETEDSLLREEFRNQGFSEQQIDQWFWKKGIHAMQPIDFATPSDDVLIESDVPTVGGDPQYSQLDPEDVKSLAVELNVNPATPSGIDTIYKEFSKRSNPGQYELDMQEAQEEVKQFISNATELYEAENPFRATLAFFGHGAAAEGHRLAKQEMVNNIVELGKERGYNLVYGTGQNNLPADEWFLMGENGEAQPVTPGLLQTMSHFKGEIAGGIAGAKVAADFTQSWESTPYTRLAKWGLVTAGAVAGAVAGDQADYTLAAIAEEQQQTWKMGTQKAIGAAQWGIIGEVAGLAVYKLGAAGYRGIMNAYKHIRDGNLDGAYDILLRSLDLTDEQAREIVERWEVQNGREAPTRNFTISASRREKEKALAILPTTQAGGEHIAREIARNDPRTSAAIAGEINRRATSLLNAARDTAGDDAGRMIYDSFNKYVNDTKDFYNHVKMQATDIQPKGYRFSIDTLVSKELRESLISRAYKPNRRQTMLNQFERLDKLLSSRTFEDLIEARQLVNEFKGAPKLKDAEIQALNNALRNIDDEISRVGNMTPEGKEWLESFEIAKKSYSEMRSNVTGPLGKVIFRPGVSSDIIAKAFVKYGNALDDTYKTMMKEFNPVEQEQIEGKIIEEVIQKWTEGLEGEFKATSFPDVAKELAKFDFNMPGSQALQQVIEEFAEIYRNDQALSFYVGGISPTKFAHYLTTDPVVRAKFEIASGVFNRVKQIMGGAQGDAAAAVNIAKKLLEEPLNPSNVEDALKLAKEDKSFQAAVRNLAKAEAEARKNGGPVTSKIKIYLDSSGNRWTQPGPGRTATDSIPMHRMTSEDVAKKILQLGDDADLTQLSKYQRAKLMNKGHVAIGLEDGSVLDLTIL